MNFGCFVRRPWLVVIVLATHTLIDYSAVPTYTQIIMKYFLSFSIENKKKSTFLHVTLHRNGQEMRRLDCAIDYSCHICL